MRLLNREQRICKSQLTAYHSRNIVSSWNRAAFIFIVGGSPPDKSDRSLLMELPTSEDQERHEFGKKSRETTLTASIPTVPLTNPH